MYVDHGDSAAHVYGVEKFKVSHILPETLAVNTKRGAAEWFRSSAIIPDDRMEDDTLAQLTPSKQDIMRG
jgi:hypothetical protein